MHSDESDPGLYVSTGIPGFDEVAGGGLPRGRLTVVFGGAGSGKTIFAAQTLAHGARHEAEPGLFVAFEEDPQRIIAHTAAFDWRLARNEPNVEVLDAQLGATVVQGGDFDLAGLLAMVASRVKARGVRRVVFDGLDVLLGHLSDTRLVRREIFRLREWAQNAGVTTIVTAKADTRARGSMGDYDFLQFLADCVVFLQQRVEDGMAFRLLQVAKHRGSDHTADEVPFTLGRRGIDLGGATRLELRHEVFTERISSGIPALDALLGGGGYFRGSSTLITGAPGTSKTTLAAAFARACAERKEPTLFVSFDEAPAQIVRNVASVGIQLQPHLASGALQIYGFRSRARNPETHVGRIRSLLEAHRATSLIIDPISALGQSGSDTLSEGAALGLLDLAKSMGITALCTSLLGNEAPLSERTPIGISTIADTWMHVSYMNHGGERNRALSIVKSRGTAHSNQVRELILSDDGIALPDVYSVGGEVLMGTLRWLKENEQRRQTESAEREGTMREREAEFRLAEARARAQAALSEQALREAALARVQLERQSESSRVASEHQQLRERRGASELAHVSVDKSS
jgi:circadian clock protein KaiC